MLLTLFLLVGCQDSGQDSSLVNRARKASENPIGIAETLVGTSKNIVDQRLDNLEQSKEASSSIKEEKETNSSPEMPAKEQLLKAEVIRVVDGDTILVKLDGKEEKVRFIGVDTPESTGKYKDEPEPYGLEASKFTKDHLDEKEIYLEFDVGERDKYKRLLAYVWLDRKMFNETLLREGYAQVMTVPPNVKYSDYFLKIQREAKKNNRGLWGL